MDEEKLELARQAAAERGLATVEFRAGNLNDWHEPAAYDVVTCRFVLQHLNQPVDLLRRMWNGARPGGVIVVEDADFDGLFCEPHCDAFDFYLRMYRSVLRQNGGDPAAGRKLYRYFLEVGIPAVELHVVQGVAATGKRKTLALSTLHATADAIVAAGLASAAEVATAIDDLAVFTADDSTVIGDPRVFQLWARR